MIPLCTAEEMRSLDNRTINGLGIPGVVLMEHAGRGVVKAIEERFGLRGKRLLVFAGKGNNGGDGFVVARWARRLGAHPKVLLLTKLENLKGDALINARVWKQLSPEGLIEVEDSLAFQGVFDNTDLVVDAILGTGLSSGARGLAAEAIEAINSSGVPVVAVDIPSGLSSDSGAIPGPAVKAELSVTFGLPKVAHWCYPARELVGEVVVVDIGIPPAYVEEASFENYLIEDRDLLPFFPKRPPQAHKGRYGHLLVLAGSPGKLGAGIMASLAALRTGAGLVTAGVPAGLNLAFEAAVMEAMSAPLPEAPNGGLGADALEEVLKLTEGKSAVAMGPGMGTDPSTKSLMLSLVERLEVPMVIDADGINLVAEEPEVLKRAKAPVILTPHPGEMARFCSISAKEIQECRLEMAREFAQRFGVIMVLKGAGTITALPNGVCYINPTGTPGMASGGSGDVLTGIISGLVCQGIAPEEAAWAGVYLHGRAGELATEMSGEYGMIAGDMLGALPDAIEEIADWTRD